MIHRDIARAGAAPPPRRAATVLLLMLLCLAGLPLQAAGSPARAAGAPTYYTITDLGPLAEFDNVFPTGIDATGRIVGYATDSSVVNQTPHAFLWQDGAMTALPTLPGGYSSQATAINASGQAIGRSTSTDYREHAVLWQGGGVADLGLAPDSYSTAAGINDNGQIAGSMSTPTGTRAFRWQNGVATDLGTLPGGDSSYAAAINASGHVVGYAGVPGGWHPFLWRDGSMTDLGTLPDLPLGEATGINATGQVIGRARRSLSSSSRTYQAFLWQGGAKTELPGLAGGTATTPRTSTTPLAINDLGQIVGWAADTYFSSRAALWQAGAATDLNDLLLGGADWTLEQATAINGRGQIAGFGTKGGFLHGFLLTPSTTGLTSLALTAAPGGGVTAAPAGPSYRPGTEVTLTPTAQPGGVALFTGWVVDGAFVGHSATLTITMDTDHAVQATFGVPKDFCDLHPGDPAYEATRQLSARAIINGFTAADGRRCVGPDDSTLRHQMAALIVRAMPGWADESGQPTFTDNTEDIELMQRVATVQRHGVAQGYQDEVCRQRGLAPPCYGPLDTVKYGQGLLFIARAMVAKGYWTLAPDDRTLFPDQNGAAGADPNTDRQTLDHRMVVTYVRHAGPPPEVSTAPDAPFVVTGVMQGEWGDPSTRGWFARAFWRALNSYFAGDRVP